MPSAESAALRLDGQALARELRAATGEEVRRRTGSGLGAPGLAVLRVGEDPASAVYVRNKVRACADAGIHGVERHFPAAVPEAAVLDCIATLNADPAIHGILVQLPLPAHLDSDRILAAVDPRKDVDGFHPANVAALALGRPGHVPCTPRGVMEILKRNGIGLSGTPALVLGRSRIVGKPMAALLLAADATVIHAHSRTPDLASWMSRCDVVVSAVGKPGLIRPEWIQSRHVVVDVGINRIEDPDLAEDLFATEPARLEAFRRNGHALVGDVHPAGFPRSRAYTPVPGGVGPMTIAMLLANTLDAQSAGAAAAGAQV